MKIIELYAENIKRLSAVEIAPNGALVQITGKNGNGKTSVLDAIWWALSSAKHIQSVPIRKGQNSALIRLDLGELKVTRTFRKAKGDADAVTTSLVVENADGARFPSPQRVIDDLVGALSMDPLEFMRADPREQLKTLRAFVPDVDFAALEKANADDFAKRTELNRNAKALRAQAAGIAVPAGTPSERVDETALVEELEKAGEHNADIERRKANRDRAAESIRALEVKRDDLIARADDLRRQADALTAQAGEADDEATALRKKLADADPLPEPIDTADVRRRIAEARDANAAVAKREARADVEKRAAAIEAQSEELTAAMDARKVKAADAVAKASFPVEGLSIGDDGVMLNGLPLDQASDAEQLRTSIAIAMAMNPKLRVLRVRDGSLLDDDAIKLLAGMAEDRDFQVWLEKVDSSGKVGFVIEDGSVVARPAADAAE